MLLDFVVKPKKRKCCVFLLVFYLASFGEKRRTSVFRFYKKSSILTRVVWAGDLKTGLGIKIGPQRQKL